MPTPKLSVVICNGRTDYPTKTISSIKGNNESSDIEIIVVSNNPKSNWNIDHFDESIRVVCALNSKANVSRNLGAWIATGQYVLFLDDDVILDPTFIDKSLAIINQNPDGAISILHIGTENKGHLFNENGLIIKRSIIIRGGFNEKLGPGTLFASSEALDLKFRLLRYGVKLVKNDGVVLHPPLADTETADKVFLYAIGNCVVALKYKKIGHILFEIIKSSIKTLLNITKREKQYIFARHRLACLIAGLILYEKHSLD
jgi:glycosyltransferase involved in cell wall biosynthesis